MDLLFELECGNPEVQRAAAEIRQVLHGTNAFATPTAELGPELERALRAGAVVIEERKPPSFIPKLPEPEAASAAEAVATELTFIAIEVRDEDDNPVSTRFRIQLPDGEVRQGYTSTDGKARMDRIPAGTAKIEFPDFADGAVSAG